MSERRRAEKLVALLDVIERCNTVTCIEEGARDAMQTFCRGIKFRGFCYILSRRMRSLENLRGRLTEVVDDADLLCAFFLISNAVEVDSTLVCHPVEDIGGLDSSFAPLFVPKDQVDPAVNICAHVRTFKRFSLFSDEDSWVTLSPRR